MHGFAGQLRQIAHGDDEKRNSVGWLFFLATMKNVTWLSMTLQNQLHDDSVTRI